MFGLPFKRFFDGTSIHAPYEQDLLVSFKELPANSSTSHKLTHFDELSVSVQWFSGASTLTSYLVQGSPYMTFLYNEATVSIVSYLAQVTSANNQPVSASSNPTISAQKIKFTLSNGGVWIIYSLTTAITVKASPTGFVSSAKFSGVIRIARLNATFSDTEALLDQYSPNYATSANISYSINGNTGSVVFSWNVGGGNPAQLLQLGWAHHRSILTAPTSLVPHVQFLTVKGYQSGIVGQKWVMQYRLTNISWFAPRARDSSCDSILNKAINFDVTTVHVAIPGDFYNWGKTIQKMARLAVIAEEIGRKELIPPIVTALEESFQYWLNGNGPDPIAYETLWGGDVSEKGTQNVNIDYGNGFYNDHHFHYGYHLYGAAVIARYDSTWLAKAGRYVNELARDIGNPSSLDPYYPITRMKDWFAGHSWASGIGYGGGERDEESTSEAINGYHGLYMWALASGNTALADFARILLATEIHSVQYYWHLYPTPTHETPYPEQGLRDLTTIGNLESVQAGAWLWWGGEKSEIASIQLLPYHPISEDNIDLAWAQAMYNWASVEIPNPAVGDGWKGYVYMAHATFNNAAAFAQAQTLKSFDSGNTYTNTLWWIATRPKTSSGPTCSGSIDTIPYTEVFFKAKSNGMYIAFTGAAMPLKANSASAGASAKFILQWVPGGYNLNSTAAGLWVTADAGGANPLDSSRTVTSTWETFAISPASNGYYTILAANNLLVAVQPNMELIANVVPSANPPDSALFTVTDAASVAALGKMVIN